MSTKKRGRPKENDLRHELQRGARAKYVESLALELGAKAAAERLGMSVRRVEQIRKYYREHGERIRSEVRRMPQTWGSSLADADMGRKLGIVGKLLTAGTFDRLLELDFGAGREIMERLAEGAEAHERAAALEAQVRRLQTRLAATVAFYTHSPK